MNSDRHFIQHANKEYDEVSIQISSSLLGSEIQEGKKIRQANRRESRWLSKRLIRKVFDELLVRDDL
jgi:hypothetical protein